MLLLMLLNMFFSFFFCVFSRSHLSEIYLLLFLLMC